MSRIITYGTFDLFHIGHLNLIKKLSAMADEVYVAVSTDEFNRLKGKTCAIPYQQRADIIEAIRHVDKVIPENSWDQKVEDVIKHNIDIFAIGKDWEGEFDFLKPHCEVKYLERTEGISSSELKQHVSENF